MKSIFLLFVSAFCIVFSAFGQGSVRGKVTDNNGETVIGASVTFKHDPGTGTVTDLDGNYSLKVPIDTATLVIQFIGFQPVQKPIELRGGEVIKLDVTMLPKKYDLKVAVVEAKANRGGDYYMEKIKKNSATTIDYISAETIRKSGDSQVSSAVQRVSGVSSVGGSVTVRGLADRYVLTTVNGSRIPTLDPFTNNLDLDIFPTGLVDNIVVTKSASPELPGDWSGAYISLETKDYPDRFRLEVRSSIGYNTQSTFEENLSSESSDTDWLGWDNGFRDIPDGVPLTQDDYPLEVNNPDLYTEFGVLGLEGYMNSLGVTGETNIASGDVIHRLAMVELDLLGAANLYNQGAVDGAVAEYNKLYDNAYFFPRIQSNQQLSAIGQSFNNTWFTIENEAPLNTSQTITLGNQTKLFGRTLGFNVGVRYSRAIFADNNAELNRSSRPSNWTGEGGAYGNISEYDTRLSQESYNLSGLVNLAYKLNPNNSIKFMFMPNFLGQNNARYSQGQTSDVPEETQIEEQFYEERKQLIYQVATQHYLPKRKIKIAFDASYTDGQRNAPDFKDISILRIPDPNYPDSVRLEFLNTAAPARRYREMDDNLFDSRISAEMPLSLETEGVAKLKFGMAYLYNSRENSQTIYTLDGVGQEVIEGDKNDQFTPDRFTTEGRSSFDLKYVNGSVDADSDVNYKEISAAFAMIDYNITERFRAVGGVRVEYTDIFTDIRAFHEEEIPSNDDRRNVPGFGIVNPTSIYSLDVLPSVSLIYKLKDNDQYPVNLRANYFMSVGRPSFKELAPVELADYELQSLVRGNPDLEITKVQNVDVRAESYFKNGHNVSVSVFYKTFKNHIELIAVPGAFTWQNVEDSYALGLELEGAYMITKFLEARANISLIKSETTVTEPVKETRTMFGQAPYIVNAMLSYEWEKVGLISTVSYNRQGPKLAVVANSGAAVPNVYEMPRDVLDLKFSKTLGDHFGLSLKIRNLLNAPVQRSYDFDEGRDVLYFDSFKIGTTYTLTLSYKI